MFGNNNDYSYLQDFVNYLLLILDKIAELFAKLKGSAAADDAGAEEGAEG